MHTYIKIYLDEFIDHKLNYTSRLDLPIINSGPITLDGSPAYKIIGGSVSPTYAGIFSKKGDKLYSINYEADPFDYDTNLPGVQKIVDSFRMFVS